MPRLMPLALAFLLTGCTPAAPTPPVPAAATPAPFASASATPPVALGSAAPLPPTTPMPAPIHAPTGLLVPLYEPPSRQGWADLVALKRRHPSVPITAIVNPDNGPSWAPDPAYDAGIERLKAAGITVVGYLSTNYGKRDPAKVASDLARWKLRAPALDGLFIDELATKASAAGFYGDVVDQAHANGLPLIIGNAGTTPDGAIAALVDVVVAYEKSGLPRPAAEHLAHDHVAALAYEVQTLEPAQVRAAARDYGWLYVTEATLDENPWGHLSRHAEALAAALDASALD